MDSKIKFILTDIEGTTTSVSFVYDVLFPYFRSHIEDLKGMTANEEVQKAFKKTVELAASLEGIQLTTVDQVIETLLRWSIEDRKITPLKTVQGILWKVGYEKGEIKGHVYEEVAAQLNAWTAQGLSLGVYSSGSVAAQKLLFGYSEAGDLTPLFSAYFDTHIGMKREQESYERIAKELALNPQQILFLSDIKEELEAATAAGFQTIQLVRPGTTAAWNKTVENFTQIEVN